MGDPATYRPAPGSVPDEPGVYRFRDASGRVIYVGKAKSLRSRLNSYFSDVAGLHARTRQMVLSAVAVDWTVVATEVEALQLEYNWIKEFDPRFNVRYRDDKSYPSLAVTLYEEYPQLRVLRGPKRKGVRYFGPYSHAWAIRETLDLLLRVFPARTCSGGVFKRAGQVGRPCLLGYIDKCSAPCVGRVSASEHRRIVEEFCDFMAGSTTPYLKRLRRQMDEASQATEYERAARLRDDIRALERALEKQAVVLGDGTDADVIGVAEDPLEAAVQVFHVRGGRVRGQRGMVVDKVEDVTTGEVVERFLEQFYGAQTEIAPAPQPARPGQLRGCADDGDTLGRSNDARVLAGDAGDGAVQGQPSDARVLAGDAGDGADEPAMRDQPGDARGQSSTTADAVPRELLLSALPPPDSPVHEWLERLRGGRVDLRVPRRGDKRALLDTVERNAAQAFTQHKLRRASDLTARSRALSQLQEALGLAEAPLRIECFDVSNLQGDDVVASMVVFEDGLARRSEYRRFEIRGVGGQDDVASLQEAVIRRFRRYLDERVRTGDLAPDGDATVTMTAAKFAYPPNLVVVDGGGPQVAAAQQALEALGVDDVAVCGLAKRMEEVWLPGCADPVVLSRTSEALYLLQRVRDEAHRFAITYHRQKRSRTMVASALDDVPGLGEARRRALLRHFGSLKRLRGGVRAGDRNRARGGAAHRGGCRGGAAGTGASTGPERDDRRGVGGRGGAGRDADRPSRRDAERPCAPTASAPRAATPSASRSVAPPEPAEDGRP